MAKLYNLIRVTTPTTGTGTIVLGAAVAGYLSFDQGGLRDGDIVAYTIKDGSKVEYGRGAYHTAGPTLGRAVIQSSDGPSSPLDLSGSAEVYISEVLGNSSTMTIPVSGIPGRITEYLDESNLQASTLIKSGAGLLTLNADDDALVTVHGSGELVLGAGVVNRLALWSDAHTLVPSYALTDVGDLMYMADGGSLETQTYYDTSPFSDGFTGVKTLAILTFSTPLEAGATIQFDIDVYAQADGFPGASVLVAIRRSSVSGTIIASATIDRNTTRPPNPEYHWLASIVDSSPVDTYYITYTEQSGGFGMGFSSSYRRIDGQLWSPDPIPARLPIGTSGQFLRVVGGLPAWSSVALPATYTPVANQFLTGYDAASGTFSSARPTWANVDKATSSLADITTRSHTLLTDIGSNTHAQIDTALTRLANTSGTNTGDVTISDTSSVDMSLTGQSLSAVVLPAGVDHNALLNYAANRHFLQTDIDHLSTALATGLVKVTTATGAISIVTDNSANWNTAFSWGNHASAGYALQTTTISVSGLGLSGGGDLSANRTITLASDATGAATAHIVATASDGSSRLVRLGLGQAATSNRLDAFTADTTSTSGTLNNAYFEMQANPPSASSGVYRAVQFLASGRGSQNITGSVTALFVQFQNFNTAALTSANGLNFSVSNNSTGTITDLRAVIANLVTVANAGTVTRGYLFDLSATVGSGSTVTTLRHINLASNVSGTLTNHYYIYLNTFANTGGTNNYGIYISDLSAATNNYAIQTNKGLVSLGDQLKVVGWQDIVQNIIKLNSTQTANALEIQPSSSTTPLLSVTGAGHLSFGEGINQIAGTTTGTKIGTAASQKLGFWNAAPVVQQTGDLISALSTNGIVGTPVISHGAMYGDDIGVTVTISATNTFYEVGSGLSAGTVSPAFTFQSSKQLKCNIAGTYLVVWHMSIVMASGANQHVEGTVMVNSTANLTMADAKHIQNTSDDDMISGCGILTLAVNDVVKLCLDNETNTNNVVVNHASLSLVRVA